ncbi:hypothetical protein [Actinacidiphila sp. bgisy167]|uniref:hypothetical protein n=1 Tax=Actinacidiphila sp. bgisy167 TaxID=3413797 RepID=UPI003D766204
MLDPDLSGTAQAAALAALGEEITRREAAVPAERRAARLDVLPERIGYEQAVALRPQAGPMRPLVGVGGDTLGGLAPDLSEVPTFVIAGPPRTGRSTALLSAARSVLDAGAGLIVLAPRRSPLRRSFEGRPGVAAVITDADVSVADFRQVLGSVPEDNAVIVIDDAELFMAVPRRCPRSPGSPRCR